MRNEKLVTARKERGWTQEKAAEKIGVSRITYARWEAKGTIPHLSTISMASEAFNMPPEQLGFRSSVKDQPLESDEDMDRRQAMQEIGKAIGATSILLDMPQTLLNSDDLERLIRALIKPSRVDSETIIGLQKTIENYWRLRIQGSIGSPELLNAAIGHFRIVTKLLQQCHIPTTRTHICTVASETAQLTGRLLVDIRDHHMAQSYYRDSLIIAQQSNNNTLYATGLGRMATVFAALGKPQDALSLLETAQQGVADTNSFTLSAWLAAETAETQAETGNQDACWKALEQASLFASQIQPGEYTYGEIFDASRVPAYQGTCHMRLHHSQLAIPALQEGLHAPQVPDGLKQSILLDITEANIQSGEVEQACNYMHQALDIIRRLQAARYIQRAYRLRQRMNLWGDVQVVKEVDERLHNVVDTIS